MRELTRGQDRTLACLIPKLPALSTKLAFCTEGEGTLGEVMSV